MFSSYKLIIIYILCFFFSFFFCVYRFEGVKVPSSKVRVSFFESSDKKYVISAPDSCGSDDFVIYEQFVMSSPTQSNNTNAFQCSYERQERYVFFLIYVAKSE
jgi:hypothetical protein